jgi:hypothetical protein
MTSEVLIDFEDLETQVVQKETIWDIENNEKMQILSFIEQQIMAKVQCILDEKDKKISQLEQELAITNNLCATLYHRSNCLSNIYIDLNPKHLYAQNFQYGRGWPMHYKFNSQEIEIKSPYPHDGTNFNRVLWENIELLYNLTKLTLTDNANAYEQQRVTINKHVFKRIKSNSIKELIINTTDHNVEESVHYILQNIPNLEILKLQNRCDCSKLVDELSSINHKLTKILVPVYWKTKPWNMELLTEYCNKVNIELILLD